MATDNKNKYEETMAQLQKTVIALQKPTRVDAEMMSTLGVSGEVQKYIADIHKHLLTNLDDGENEIFQKIQNDTTNKFTKKLEVLRNSTRDEAVKQSIFNMQKTMEQLFNKYRYFEYKYVQSNVLFLKFMQDVQQLFGTYAKYSSDLIQSTNVKHIQDMKDLLDSIIDMRAHNNEGDAMISDAVISQFAVTVKNNSEAAAKAIKEHGKMVEEIYQQLMNLPKVAATAAQSADGMGQQKRPY